LLSKATGEWVYFLGDDDAMMPHAASHLQYLTEKYPQCEAVVAPRAYYLWPGHGYEAENILGFHIGTSEEWVDSKQQLERCLNGDINYLLLPQIYSGGFQRRSLITRVKNSQNGIYFKSVSPDAYSALMGCALTYRHLKIAVPLAWVGTSPKSPGVISGEKLAKDRIADFWGMHDDGDMIMHRALGDLKEYTFTLVFFEAYLSAMPMTSMRELSTRRLRNLYMQAALELRDSGREDVLQNLGNYMGFDPPSAIYTNLKAKQDWIVNTITKFKARATRRLRSAFSMRQMHRDTTIDKIHSKSYDPYPNILSCNEDVAAAYSKWQCRNSGFGMQQSHLPQS